MKRKESINGMDRVNKRIITELSGGKEDFLPEMLPMQKLANGRLGHSLAEIHFSKVVMYVCNVFHILT